MEVGRFFADKSKVFDESFNTHAVPFINRVFKSLVNTKHCICRLYCIAGFKKAFNFVYFRFCFETHFRALKIFYGCLRADFVTSSNNTSKKKKS